MDDTAKCFPKACAAIGQSFKRAREKANLTADELIEQVNQQYEFSLSLDTYLQIEAGLKDSYMYLWAALTLYYESKNIYFSIEEMVNEIETALREDIADNQKNVLMGNSACYSLPHII